MEIIICWKVVMTHETQNKCTYFLSLRDISIASSWDGLVTSGGGLKLNTNAPPLSVTA